MKEGGEEWTQETVEENKQEPGQRGKLRTVKEEEVGRDQTIKGVTEGKKEEGGGGGGKARSGEGRGEEGQYDRVRRPEIKSSSAWFPSGGGAGGRVRQLRDSLTQILATPTSLLFHYN